MTLAMPVWQAYRFFSYNLSSMQFVPLLNRCTAHKYTDLNLSQAENAFKKQLIDVQISQTAITFATC